MGTPVATLAGVGTGTNIAHPSIRHFRKYIKINKELSDFSIYSTTGPAGAGTVSANS